LGTLQMNPLQINSLRFVFVLSSFQLYGGVLLVIEYANRLTKRGHSVQLFTPNGTVDPTLLKRLHPSIAVIESGVSLPTTTRSFLALVRLLWSMARELPPADVVVATHTPTVAAILLARIVGTIQTKQPDLAKRSALAWLYMDYPEMFRDRPVERILSRVAPRWFDVIWTISVPLKEAVSAYTNNPIVVTGSGLQNDELLFNQPRIQSPDERKRIFYVGNTKPRKGLRDFLAAMNVVYEHDSNIQVVIAGAEDCRSLIEQCAIAKLDDKAIIEFHAKPSDLELTRLYASSDLFISASWGEGLGYPPLEAMACGTPVVLTDSGGVRDYARHEENCLMVLPKDVSAMAEATARLVGDAELAERLSCNGRKTARLYDWEAVMDQVVDSAYHITNMRMG